MSAPRPAPVTRRTALFRLGAAGGGWALANQAAAGRVVGVLAGEDRPLIAAGHPVEVLVSSVSPSTVRLTVARAEDAPLPRPNHGALLPGADAPVLARRRIASGRVEAGDLVVRCAGDPLTLLVETRDGATIQRLRLDPSTSAVSFLLGKGPLLGFGAGGPQLDRKGWSYSNRNGQGGFQLRTHGGRVPIQWLASTDGWGLFVHRPLGAFDLTVAEGILTPAEEALPLDVFVTASREPAALLREYARITGLAELPPLWAFGYMQSHRTLAGPEEIESVARGFRERKLPCDALIYLGTEFTPSGWNTRNGEFSWKRENFPDPKAFVEGAHARNYKVVLHVVIEGQHMDGAVGDPCAPERAVPSGRTPDDRWPAERAVPCYWPYHKPLLDLGVDGFWPDQGDGLDEPSRLARIRMYWAGPQRERPGVRPFALHRNGAPGMQRYGAFLWSGDVYSTWETLKTHVPVAINAGLSGIPFWGTDVGGFVPTAEYTGELHLRWLQFGCFCPSFRAHGRNWHLRLPWGWNTGELGPSELRGYTGGAADPDPAELRNPRVEPIVRKYLELRYLMLPYTYSVARECTLTGLPMIRALWLHHSEDAQAVARGDQFLWGRDILVSPVVEKGAASRRLYLPRGSWFDYWTEERVAGGREVERPVDLETLPLHVRAGAILPLGPVKQYADEPSADPLALLVYPGADGAFLLYQDDGRSFAYRDGAWMGCQLTWANASRTLALALAPGSRMLQPALAFQVRVAGSTSVQRVVFEGRPIEIRL